MYFSVYDAGNVKFLDFLVFISMNGKTPSVQYFVSNHHYNLASGTVEVTKILKNVDITLGRFGTFYGKGLTAYILFSGKTLSNLFLACCLLQLAGNSCLQDLYVQHCTI